MTVQGFFSDVHLVFGEPSSQTPVPYVSALVELPQFGQIQTVNFLLDTGADFSVLNLKTAPS